MLVLALCVGTPHCLTCILTDRFGCRVSLSLQPENILFAEKVDPRTASDFLIKISDFGLLFLAVVFCVSFCLSLLSVHVSVYLFYLFMYVCIYLLSISLVCLCMYLPLYYLSTYPSVNLAAETCRVSLLNECVIGLSRMHASNASMKSMVGTPLVRTARCVCASCVCVVCVRCVCALCVCVVCVRRVCASCACVVCARCVCASCVCVALGCAHSAGYCVVLLYHQCSRPWSSLGGCD